MVFSKSNVILSFSLADISCGITFQNGRKPELFEETFQDFFEVKIGIGIE